jgi:predicted ester cyclase
VARTNPENVVKKAIAAINRHDLDAYIAMLDPNYIEPPNPAHLKPQKGTEAERKSSGDAMKAFPDMNFKILNIAAKGGFVAAETILTATFKGPWEVGGRTIPPTGRHLEAKWAMFLRVNSRGLITEKRDYFDSAGLFQQLGMNA